MRALDASVPIGLSEEEARLLVQMRSQALAEEAGAEAAAPAADEVAAPAPALLAAAASAAQPRMRLFKRA